MRLLSTFLAMVAICAAAIVPDASFAQSGSETEYGAAELLAEANQEQGFTSKPYALGEYMIEAGGYLKKAYRYFPGIQLLRSKKFEWGLFYYIFGRPLVGFTVPYYIGDAGEQLIGASTAISPQTASLMKKAGEKLKAYRTSSYLSEALFWGGLIAALSKSENSTILGGSAMLVGGVFRIISLHQIGSAGKALEDISSAFSTDTQRTLMRKAGGDLRAYKKHTYWGRGIQGLGIAAAIVGFAQENTSVGTAGLLTALLSGLLTDTLVPAKINSAGERLEELGNVLF